MRWLSQMVYRAFSVELKSLVFVLIAHLISAGLSKTVAAQKAVSYTHLTLPTTPYV